MNRYMKMVGISTVICGMSLTGSAFAAKSSGTSPIADSWVTARTKIALAADGRVKGSQVSVETEKGIVTLRGKVDNADAKRVAKQIAQGMDGARRVDNELQVVAPDQREAVEEKDEAITERVKLQIDSDADHMKDTRLKDAKIGVVTHAGVVSLTGEVPSLLVSAQASWTAWQVQGVKSVKNDLLLTTN